MSSDGSDGTDCAGGAAERHPGPHQPPAGGASKGSRGGGARPQSRRAPAIRAHTHTREEEGCPAVGEGAQQPKKALPLLGYRSPEFRMMRLWRVEAS
eukprot:3793-Prorocentrum_minimum.AAC.2